MFICFLIFLKLGLCVNYLVSLKPKETYDNFIAYDATYPIESQVKDLIDSKFQIGSFTGFSGNFTEKHLERFKRCPLIDEISPDIKLESYDVKYQQNAPRHLARLSRSKRMKPRKEYPYVYDDHFTGKRVNAYVIDSGIEIGHPELQGRARLGKDFTNTGIGDLNGHGTHVAGLIGSNTYGVAKNVNIIDIKALNERGVGNLSTVIKALEFVVNHRINTEKPGVVNLSLGAYRNNILNNAIEQAAKTELVFVVAAGNSNLNACLTSPSSSPYAITVGAIDDYNDSITSFSNWGECVDLFASGAFVKSIDKNSFEKVHTLSGTSMAAPIVSGLVANLLSEGIDPHFIRSELIKLSTKNKIKKTSMLLRRGTPNRIAFNGVEHKLVDEGEDSDNTNW
ncbi:unnamed protein product [Candida verbasci]|uniref:Peptidase S8/S53 domain-containing protein n=1 Tax=Candida verbasci TaxID=1227364 RepID=A0A9W4X7Z1_9ASCO|nr:unnamed protein product [Candida verbasci]